MIREEVYSIGAVHPVRQKICGGDTVARASRHALRGRALDALERRSGL